MRDREAILKNVRFDITDERYEDTRHLWIEHNKIEVLIDIRDMLNDLTSSLRLFAKHLDLKKQ